MIRRSTFLFLLITLTLPVGALRAEETTEVTTSSPEARQLQALMNTDAKLCALSGQATAPKQGTPLEHRRVTLRKKRIAPRRARKNGPVAPPKVTSRRLSESEVRGIMATTRDFSGADLSGLNLAGTDLSRANFSRANLNRTNLERADLSESDLELADLSGAKLSRASLEMARLHGTKMEGARLDGALWLDRTVCRSGSLGRCLE